MGARDGEALGDVLGTLVGESVNPAEAVGSFVVLVGECEGTTVGTADGMAVGDAEGAMLG